MEGHEQDQQPRLILEIDGERISIRQDVLDALTEIAARNNLPWPVAIEQAIKNEKFLEDRLGGGEKLIVREKNGDYRELVFEPEAEPA